MAQENSLNSARKERVYGFSLIELSIIIVLLGLVVGSVIGGKSLLNQARLNSVIRDWKTHQAAINAFRSQYNYMPGDFPDAWDYWQDQPLCPNDTVDEDRGCNGNGDGILGGTLSYQGVYEPLIAWHHMLWAGVLPEGTVKLGGPNLQMIRWRQTVTNPTVEYYPGTGIYGNSIPLSKLRKHSGYTLFNPSMDNNWTPPAIYGRSGTWIMVIYPQGGNVSPLSGLFGHNSTGASATPADAALLDKKIDDGKPATGSVIASRWWAGTGTSGNCTNPNIVPGNMATATNLSAVTYLTSNTGYACNPMFYYED
jgi:hypothetical protein